MATKKLNPRLYRGDSTFAALDLEGEIKKADDLKKRRTQRRQSFSNIEGIAMAAKEQQIKERANAPVTILAPLKRVPKPLTRTYKMGLRKKSSEKRESRSRSNGSIVVAEEPNEKSIEEEIQANPKVSFLPPANSSSTNKPSSILPSIFNRRRKTGVPLLRLGGKKTAKRRRAKKSCGWFW
jgi:hypothetical protein